MALITKIVEEFKPNCSGITVGIKIASIAPSIAYIEKNFIKKELGTAQYDALITAYNLSVQLSPTAMSAANQALWNACVAALAPLSAWHYAGSNASELSDAGQRESAADGWSGARLWVSNLQRDTWYAQGMKELDNLLTFLDENKDDYALWVAGTGYAGLKSNIMQTTAQFNEQVCINDSRSFFKKLKPTIKQVEFLTIRKYISATLYARLIEGLKEDDLTAQEQAVIDLLIPAIAHLTIGECKLPVQLDTNGVYKSATTTYASGKASDESAVDDSVLQGVMRQHAITGKQYLNEAVDYLNKTATASILSEYFESSLYEDPTASGYGDLKHNNDELATICSL